METVSDRETRILLQKILEELRAIRDTTAPKPGPHCRFCDTFQQCPAMLNDAHFLMGALSRRTPMT